MYALRLFGENTCLSCIPVLFQILVKAWEVGVFAPGCESQLNLAALPYMENHVWSHMEKKLIQFYRIVQFNVVHQGIQALHNNLRKRKWNSKGYTKSHKYNSRVDPHSFWLAYLKSNTKLLGLPGMRRLKHRDICTCWRATWHICYTTPLHWGRGLTPDDESLLGLLSILSRPPLIVLMWDGRGVGGNRSTAVCCSRCNLT